MPNDAWQVPDIEGMLKERQDQIDSGDKFPLSYHQMPAGRDGYTPGMHHPDELQLGEDQYIIDPDYAEIMGAQWEDLIKYKK
jgi:hypothetical protein